MDRHDTDLILASASPRRRDLLAQLGYSFDVRPTEVDEAPRPGETPDALVARLARDKARAGLADAPDSLVIASDTVVAVDGEVLGKPTDRDDAVAMLARLSDRSHRVLSAVCVAGGDDEDCATSESVVWFRPVTRSECEAYWATGEPADKAGAYAIQGLAGTFVRHLEGSYTGVMGLPLFETARLLAAAGLAPPFLAHVTGDRVRA